MQMLYNAIYKGNWEVLINNTDFHNWALREMLVGLLIILAIWNSINITFEVYENPPIFQFRFL